MSYDIGVIGLGLAGTLAALKLAENKNIKVIAFDLGRKWAKRRRQLDGFLGALPNSDGKLYLNNISDVSKVTNEQKSQSAFEYFNKLLSNVGEFSIIKDKSPNKSILNKIKKINYDITLNDYIQLIPKDIHLLSKYIANILENSGIKFQFDTEVDKIDKQEDMFVIFSEGQEFRCKKLIMAVGRSGWRWAKEIYSKFNIIENNDIAKFGIRLEMNSNLLKDFNESVCTLTKSGFKIGPLCWYGTVIPEDHVDMAISAFRSNENRWKTDKVSFNLIGERIFPNKGFEQTDRIGKLTFVLSNDRIAKEKISNIINNKSNISVIPEFNWLKEAITELSIINPEILTKAYFHVPTITPIIPQISFNENFETKMDGLFAIGESSGITGLLSAGLMGIICANSILK